MTSATPNDVKAAMILPMATLYHRPKQVENEAQAKLYLDEIVASVVSTECSKATLAPAWERIKASWQFGWWPTPQAVISAIVDAQQEAAEKARVFGRPRGDPQLVHERNAKIRARAVFADPQGRQMLEDDLGLVLFENFIETGIVDGPHALTPEIVAQCVRTYGKVMLALRDAEASYSETGCSWMGMTVNLGRAIQARNERLKADYLPDYQPQTFGRIAVRMGGGQVQAPVTPNYVRSHFREEAKEISEGAAP